MLEEAHHSHEEEASNPATTTERLEALSNDPSLQAIVAGNPATPTYLLERFSRDQDAQVREKVASNPNTPWRTLEQLAWEFPHEFLSNPVVPLQMMAHSEQITTSDEFWGHLLREATVPSQWWNWLRSHQELGVSQAVRLHIQYAGEATHPYGVARQDEEHDLLSLVELLSVAFSQAASLLRRDDPVAEQPEIMLEHIIKERLQWLAHSRDESVRQGVAANEKTPVEILRILAQDDNRGVRWVVAAHPQTPVEVLCTLAQDNDREVRRTVAAHPQTPVEALHILGQDNDWEVRWGVATHPQTPVEVLRTLAQDNDRNVRGGVASHAQTPVEILRTLAQDQSAVVRRAAAENAQTPAEAFQTFARHKTEWVRVMLVNHPQTPVESLPTLAQDQSAVVRAAVASHPHVQEDLLRILARDRYAMVRRAAASHKRIPGEMLQALAQDKKAPVRAAVASHPHVPVERLSTLAQDQYQAVRKVVAANPRTPVQVLQALANDQDPVVRFWVAANPQVEANTLRTLAQDTCVSVRWMAYLVQQPLDEAEEPLQKQKGWKDLCDLLWSPRLANVKWLLDEMAGLDVAQSIRQSILALCAVDWDGETIRRAFERLMYDYHISLSAFVGMKRKNAQRIAAPFMPAIALQKLAASPYWEARYLVALHEHTSWETRQQLCQDGNRYVRAMAQAKAKMMPEQTR